MFDRTNKNRFNYAMILYASSVSTYHRLHLNNNRHFYFSLSFIFDIILFCIPRIQINCGIAITVIGVLKCIWEGGGRDVQGKGMKDARKSRMVGRTKENGICTGSQPNPTSSKCRKDGSKRVKATRSECHPLRTVPARFGLGDEGASMTVSLYFSTLYVGREGARQMRGKCGSHRSYSCNIWYSDHHNSGSTVLSLVPIKLTNDRGRFEGKHSSVVNHDNKLGYQQTS